MSELRDGIQPMFYSVNDLMVLLGMEYETARRQMKEYEKMGIVAFVNQNTHHPCPFRPFAHFVAGFPCIEQSLLNSIFSIMPLFQNAVSRSEKRRHVLLAHCNISCFIHWLSSGFLRSHLYNGIEAEKVSVFRNDLEFAPAFSGQALFQLVHL